MIRYPGSKAKLAKHIIAKFPPSMHCGLYGGATGEYREPFFGGGAVGRIALRGCPGSCAVWLNDKDRWLTCLWQAVRDNPSALIDRIAAYKPTIEDFYEYKKQDGEPIEPLDAGFKKLVLHRISYSGLGAMAGGPIGGRTQKSNFKVGCRWNPRHLSSEVRQWHNILKRFPRCRITCEDFEQMVQNAPSGSFVYLDPPYYDKGPDLYTHCMSEADHERLSLALQQSSASWVLSYDEHPRIRELYSWARFHRVEAKYTTAKSSTTRPTTHEVIITPRGQETSET